MEKLRYLSGVDTYTELIRIRSWYVYGVDTYTELIRIRSWYVYGVDTYTELIRDQLKIYTGVQTNDLNIMISGQEIVLPMHVVMSKFDYTNLTTKLTNYSSFCWRNICSYNHIVIIALSECKTMQPCLDWKKWEN